MLSLWKRRRSGKKKQNVEDDNKNGGGGRELRIPSNFVCPISLDLMKDPVMLSTGITYDRDGIEAWLEAGNRTCPLTKQVLLAGSDPVPNHAIRQMIQDWCVENADSGVERIATPKAPIASREVAEILSKIEAAGDELNGETCRELVVKLRTAMEESKRNRKRIIANSAGKVLLDIFGSFSSKDNNFLDVLEEILSTLATMLPLDAESRSGNIVTDSSLRSLEWFMNNGNLPSRSNAVLVLREILAAADQTKCDEIVDFTLEPLVNLVKDPICPAATKAALLSIYYLISKSSTPAAAKAAAALSKLGIVATITETLVDCDRSVCEKALAVLDGVCGISAAARETAINHALTIPVLVKKLHRVSELSTEFSVSVLWKLGKYDEKVVVEALRVGAFQKLLLLLQVGCSETAKEKAGELLKMMNVHKDSEECIESGDFRNLKRTF
ncbi:PREDICTED: U-box domain-containing protein 21-like [Ipomoea nil]|uniref:U-box domain-containing protein 21-like n=1 Tax=Ipomoea nil TaxID=35883 RepID=UPI000901FFB7|nr:PREDICTED: U-box domain-containing protein 21-like [Ipomoea nil]